MRKPIIIVQGGWYGSEAKGLVTHKLTIERSVDVAIRTGTVNAGHTVYHDGRPYAMQQLPVSWVKPNCTLVLGPGAYISPQIFYREVMWIADALRISVLETLKRIKVDFNCGIHLPSHTDLSTISGRHHSMGATGKGCSEAVIDKIKSRGNSPCTFNNWLIQNNEHAFWQMVYDVCLTDTVRYVNLCFDGGQQLLIEGTQGTLLDLHLGPYPFTTHKQTQAANWMAEAGLSCTLPTELWLVLRTFPIRVAGNSGPLPNELSWVDFATRLAENGHPIVADWALAEFDIKVMEILHRYSDHPPAIDPAYWTPNQRNTHQAAASEIHREAFRACPVEVQQELVKLFEFTTVTKKLRRIANWDWPTFDQTITLNRPHKIALTFMNYQSPHNWGATGTEQLDEVALDYIAYVARRGQCPVGMISYGPQIENCLMTLEG